MKQREPCRVSSEGAPRPPRRARHAGPDTGSPSAPPRVPGRRSAGRARGPRRAGTGVRGRGVRRAGADAPSPVGTRRPADRTWGAGPSLRSEVGAAKARLHARPRGATSGDESPTRPSTTTPSPRGLSTPRSHLWSCVCFATPSPFFFKKANHNPDFPSTVFRHTRYTRITDFTRNFVPRDRGAREIFRRTTGSSKDAQYSLVLQMVHSVKTPDKVAGSTPTSYQRQD